MGYEMAGSGFGSGSWSSGSGSGSGSGSSSRNFPHAISTKSGLTALYNKEVVHIKTVQRNTGSSGGILAAAGVHHRGVVVTTSDGEELLVHKGDGYGQSSQTVVVPASAMSNNWSTVSSRDVQGTKVADYVKAGGTDYSLLTDNCLHATKRMENLGQK